MLVLVRRDQVRHLKKWYLVSFTLLGASNLMRKRCLICSGSQCVYSKSHTWEFLRVSRLSRSTSLTEGNTLSSIRDMKSYVQSLPKSTSSNFRLKMQTSKLSQNSFSKRHSDIRGKTFMSLVSQNYS